MIHFFPQFADDPSDSPLAKELAQLGVAHRLYGEALSLRYKSRLGLALLGWPRILMFACRSAWRSLFRSDHAPTVVVLNSHLEVMVFGIARRLLPRRRRPAIVLLGFIYTARPQRWVRWLRERYFSLVFSIADRIICHSSGEVRQYAKIFVSAGTKFCFIPYGLSVSGEAAFAATLDPSEPPRPWTYVFAAGRSGRDYATLVEAVRDSELQLRIVCDREAPLLGIQVPSNVTVLRSCYDDDYVRELENASLVVVPLLVDDISAGQMVLIQAMAFRKPIVISRTSTIDEYVSNESECVLAPRQDVAALRSLLLSLRQDPAQLVRLANGARRAYDQRFCMRAYVSNLVQAAQTANLSPGNERAEPS